MNYEMNFKKARILFLSDVDIESATRLAEHFVPKTPQFDAIVVCGPFSADATEEIKSKEADALALGDMSSTLAQLENIVCRVIYLPAEWDPRSALEEELHLTPNTVNIHGREMPLVAGLNIAGLTEIEESIGDEEEPIMDSGDDPPVPDPVGQTMRAESKSASTVTTLLENLTKCEADSSIFLLNHRYMHTLNSFLFYRQELLEQAGIVLCVIPRSDEVTARLPTKMGNINFLVPKSLRQGGHYSFADFEITEDGPWALTKIESTQLSES